MADSLNNWSRSGPSISPGRLKKTPWTARLIFKLRSLLQEQRVDILHARSRVPAGSPGWRGSRCPQPSDRDSSRLFTASTAWGGSARSWPAATVIAVSRSIADYIRQNYPKTPAESITVIPRGIDPQEFPHALTPSPAWWSAWSVQYPNTVGREWLTLAGRITRLKGHEEFLTLIVS